MSENKTQPGTQPETQPGHEPAKKPLGALFLTMLKIGAFTFGGGYAMISLLQNEFVEKKKWIDSDEFLDLVAIAESTPGPIAINSSTYIGYRVGGFAGALLGTLAMCLPSFTVIYLISLFFDAFLSLTVVANAFRGIRVCVVFLILSAGARMFRKMKKDPAGIAIFGATFACMVAFSIFSVSFSSVFYILIAGFVGWLLYLLKYAHVGGTK